MSYKFLYTALILSLAFTSLPARSEYYVSNAPQSMGCGGGCVVEEQRWGNYPTQHHKRYTKSCKKPVYHRAHRKPTHYTHHYVKRSHYQISVTRLACSSCSCGACETVYVEPRPCYGCDMRPTYTTYQASHYCGNSNQYRRVYEPDDGVFVSSLDQSTSDDVLTSY